jgi:hypothetical protein
LRLLCVAVGAEEKIQYGALSLLEPEFGFSGVRPVPEVGLEICPVFVERDC